jgi:hypothetical protein
MSLLSSTENKPLEFSRIEPKQNYKMPTSQIGWLHTLADKPGARFDIVIRDGLGREMARKTNCGNDTEKYGELVNLPTLVGQDIQVEIENLKGAEKLQVFIN